jgi:uncharacterized damage-inducible protein DinB
MPTGEMQLTVLNAEEILKHWQGHRSLTRKTIEAFPEDKLFSFSVGGMRPFGELAWEFIRMAVPTVDGVASGHWEEYAGLKPTTRAELLTVWDRQTREINERFPAIPAHRFPQMDKAFGQWPATGIATIQYVVDNEIHHRGQGYVYLRALGIEPPHFWERQ